MAKVTTRNRNKDKFYKDGTKKPANWEYRFPIAPVNGKRQYASQAGFARQKDAFEAGTKAMAEYLGTGDAHKPEKISYADLLDLWFENHVEMNLKKQTILSYHAVTKRHIRPVLGSYYLQRIKPLDLQTLLNDMAKKGYSLGYIRQTYVILKGSLKYAVEPCQFIKHSPMAYVNMPKSQKEQRQKKVISKEDFKRILKRFPQGSTFHMPLVISYHTGLRRGEVLGLTWDNIDFKNKTLTVDKQLQLLNSYNIKQIALTTPKTKASLRTIPIGDTLLSILKKEKLLQNQNKIRYGEYYLRYGAKEITPKYHEVMEDKNGDLDFICKKESGKLLTHDAFKYLSKVVNQKLGIKFEFHALRHTHATMLVESGANVKGVQQRLGHEHVKTTLQLYTHITDPISKDTVALFEKALK